MSLLKEFLDAANNSLADAKEDAIRAEETFECAKELVRLNERKTNISEDGIACWNSDNLADIR